MGTRPSLECFSPYPFTVISLKLPDEGQALQRRSRSDLSKLGDALPAERAAIFCKAFWRMFLAILYVGLPGWERTKNHMKYTSASKRDKRFQTRD